MIKCFTSIIFQEPENTGNTTTIIRFGLLAAPILLLFFQPSKSQGYRASETSILNSVKGKTYQEGKKEFGEIRNTWI